MYIVQYANTCTCNVKGVKGMIVKAFLAFRSCPNYKVVLYALVLMYDIEIKFGTI